MFNTKIRTVDRLFEDSLYRHSHENVTDVVISRSMDSYDIEIVFTIENTEKTKMLKDIQCIRNVNIKYCRPEQLTYRANKFARLIDEVPDHIPDEQIVMWLDLRMEKYEV